MNPLNDLSPSGKKAIPAIGSVDGAQWASVDRAYQIAAFETSTMVFKEWGLRASEGGDPAEPAPTHEEPEPLVG